MKVLAFTTVFPNPALPVRGLFVYERIRHAARHAEVRVVAPVPWFHRRERAQTPRREVRGGLAVEHPTFFYVPFVGKYLDGLFLFLSALACVARLRREFDFDLIDGHFGYPDGFAAVLLGWYFRRPVTLTLRGSETEHLTHPVKRWAMAWAWRRAARVMAVAHPLGVMAEKLGVPPERVRVIPNGVDGARYAPGDAAASRKQLGRPETGKLLVSVGHLSARKGFHRVLRVLPELLRDFPDLTFVIVGGMEAAGTYEGQMRRQVAELGLSERVVLAGPQPPEVVARWLRAADLFVLASTREGCPNVVWEAMACGRPVVATRVGEVDRIVPDYAGILYDRVEDDAELLRCLREGLSRPWDTGRIRAHAEQHTWEQVAAAVLDEWRAAVGDGPVAPAARAEETEDRRCHQAAGRDTR
ncbi:MAG TPA: glycosyltransferase [Gemmataceae bacterium]|nr:glycosyltransferase [Gemmataceae bacterium]